MLVYSVCCLLAGQFKLTTGIYTRQTFGCVDVCFFSEEFKFGSSEVSGSVPLGIYRVPVFFVFFVFLYFCVH